MTYRRTFNLSETEPVEVSNECPRADAKLDPGAENAADNRAVAGGGGILLTGHSHLTAYGIPLNSEANVVMQGGDGLRGCSGLWIQSRRQPDYWSFAASHAEGGTVGILWGGNIHNYRFLFESEPPFDFLLDDDDNCDPGRWLAPRRSVERALEIGLFGLDAAVKILGENGVQRIVLLETPPPRRDLALALSGAVDRAYWLKRAREMGYDGLPAFTDARLRLKLWRLLMRMTQARAGVEMIPVPREACDADGFLLPELGAKDLTHANRAYGEIAARDLARRFGASEHDNAAPL
jgi:hypothetical protein